MGLYKTTPYLSGRMGTLWTLSTIKNSAVVEFGCMGHTVYARTFLSKMAAQGSKLYSTHIRETDIAMGDTTRLNNAISEILQDKELETIFLLPSTVPEVIGVDLKAITKELSFDYPNVSFITFDTGSFNMNINEGIEKTLLHLAKTLSFESEKSENVSYNIIGSCADMYNFNADCIEFKRVLENSFDIEKNCIMTSNTSITELKNLSKAHINLVIREEGLKTAKFLEKKFGTPYIYSRPYGYKDTLAWLCEIKSILNIELNEKFISSEEQTYKELIAPYKILMQRFLFAHGAKNKIIGIGHKDVINGITSLCKDEYNFSNIIKYVNSQYFKNDIAVISEDEKLNIKNLEKCFLFGSEEDIRLFNGIGIKVENPNSKWTNPFEAPLVSFRGGINIGTLLANEIFKLD